MSYLLFVYYEVCFDSFLHWVILHAVCFAFLPCACVRFICTGSQELQDGWWSDAILALERLVRLF